MNAKKGKIGVLIEEHFDQTEYREFNSYFPSQGYEVEYISHLWGNSQLTFGANPDNSEVEDHVTVTTEINEINPKDYRGAIPRLYGAVGRITNSRSTRLCLWDFLPPRRRT